MIKVKGVSSKILVDNVTGIGIAKLISTYWKYAQQLTDVKQWLVYLTNS